MLATANISAFFLHFFPQSETMASLDETVGWIIRIAGVLLALKMAFTIRVR